MITFLIDHNIEGQALLLWRIFVEEGWAELLSMQFVLFAQVGLSYYASDRDVWRFAQSNNMILLTANRNRKGENSLEQTIEEENTPASLPVLTIGNMERVVEKEYRENCVSRLLEVVVDLDKLLGTGRLYIP